MGAVRGAVLGQCEEVAGQGLQPGGVGLNDDLAAQVADLDACVCLPREDSGGAVGHRTYVSGRRWSSAWFRGHTQASRTQAPSDTEGARFPTVVVVLEASDGAVHLRCRCRGSAQAATADLRGKRLGNLLPETLSFSW